MEKSKKLLGEERRSQIIQWLRSENKPLTGTELSNRTHVSRQVIVQDISILKAKNEPILATSQGYIYQQPYTSPRFTKIVACYHTPEQTMDELNLLVDHGVTIKDVIIEHPIYGDITASLQISNRQEVKAFCEKIADTNATLLSRLTDGVHLHTLEAQTEADIERATIALSEHGFILNENS